MLADPPSPKYSCRKRAFISGDMLSWGFCFGGTRCSVQDCCDTLTMCPPPATSYRYLVCIKCLVLFVVLGHTDGGIIFTKLTNDLAITPWPCHANGHVLPQLPLQCNTRAWCNTWLRCCEGQHCGGGVCKGVTIQEIVNSSPC